jgi:Asp-tRNA(Asn)/Glu-tRNA(Gln) amidotransferase B subunit
VTPDSALGGLAQRLARLEQRVDDLMERIVERFAGVAEDVRIFAPMVREHDEMRAEMRFVRESVTSILEQQRRLEERIREERQQRIDGQQERKKELEVAIAERDKQHAELRAGNRKAVLAFMGVFITALAGVIIQLISQGTHP